MARFNGIPVQGDAPAAPRFKGEPVAVAKTGQHLSFEEGQKLLEQEDLQGRNGELGAFLTSTVEGAPIVGPYALSGAQKAAAGISTLINGGSYGDNLDQAKEITQIAQQQKAFTPSERLAIAEAVEREVGRRQGSRNDIISFSERKKELVGERPQVNDGEKTRDFAAKAAGFTSEKQRRRTEKIVKDGDPTLIEAVDKGDVAITKAADIANLTKPEQIVSLAGEKADRDAREDAEKALLQEVAHYKLQNPGNAYTDYLEKHKKRPDRDTAADIGRLLGGQVKADDGTMQPPKSKSQKEADRENRNARKEESNLRKQAYHAYISVCYLGQNHDDPKQLLHLINEYELPRMIEHFENAVDWFNRFAKEWRKHAEENNIK
ncbi:hypothetical protein [Rhizobium sp. X9]|uniref:hypothetical protein n=1 Tax=Rhizobium sp. X9 TaxID=2815360 RepID=UPI001C0C73AE|nr:hypothetical protein [Rhizobium sp. X9]